MIGKKEKRKEILVNVVSITYSLIYTQKLCVYKSMCISAYVTKFSHLIIR